MSGGAFNYAYSRINDFQYELSKCANTPERKAFVKHLEKVSAAAKAIEWNESGDGADEESAIMDCINPASVIEAAAIAAKEAGETLAGIIKKYQLK